MLADFSGVQRHDFCAVETANPANLPDALPLPALKASGSNRPDINIIRVI